MYGAPRRLGRQEIGKRVMPRRPMWVFECVSERMSKRATEPPRGWPLRALGAPPWPQGATSRRRAGRAPCARQVSFPGSEPLIRPACCCPADVSPSCHMPGALPHSRALWRGLLSGGRERGRLLLSCRRRRLRQSHPSHIHLVRIQDLRWERRRKASPLCAPHL